MTAMEKNIMRTRAHRGAGEREVKEFDEKVIEIQRVSRVVKGGRRIRFRALVVIGDHKGRIGMGVAKANEVAEAVRKATAQAKKCLINVPVINGTIPHEILVKYGASRIMLKPASLGTTIVAGGSLRTVAELAGITDLLAKIHGSSNKINNVRAAFKAFTSFSPIVIEKLKAMSEKKTAKERVVNEAETPVLEPKTETKNIEKEEVGEEKTEKIKKVAKTKKTTTKKA